MEIFGIKPEPQILKDYETYFRKVMVNAHERFNKPGVFGPEFTFTKVEMNRVIWDDGWWYEVSTDEGVIEIQAQSQSVDPIKGNRERIQSDSSTYLSPRL